MIKLTKVQAKKRRDLLVVIGECGGGLRSYTLQYSAGDKGFHIYDPLLDLYRGVFPYDVSGFSIYCSEDEG